MTSLSDLPDCMVTEILVRLPVKTVSACKCVCKPWDRLLSAPLFAKLHLNRGPPSHNVAILLHANRVNLVDLEDQQPHVSLLKQKLFTCHGFSTPCPLIFGSCNGLLLFNPHHYNSIFDDLYIYNPVVRKKIKLPATEKTSYKTPSSCGIGYSRASDTYKVIKITGHLTTGKSEAKICVLRGGGEYSWRNVEDPLPVGSFKNNGIYHREAIHWIVEDAKTLSVSVCCFDIETEKFRLIIPFLPHIKRYECLSLWRDSISISQHSSDGLCNIWVMKEYGKPWTKEIVMSRNGYISRILGTLPNGEIILTNVYGEKAFCYHPEHKTSRDLHCFAGCSLLYAYVPSLLSPEDL